MHDVQYQYQFRFLATVCLLLFSSKRLLPWLLRISHKPHPVIVYNQRFRIVIGESPQARMRWDRRRNKNHTSYSTPFARDAIVFAWVYKLKCICLEGQKWFEYTRCGGIINKSKEKKFHVKKYLDMCGRDLTQQNMCTM